MSIYGVYIINRAGGLIYQHDYSSPKVEVEKTFSYPLELFLKIYDEKVVVSFGQRDGIKGIKSVQTVQSVCDCVTLTLTDTYTVSLSLSQCQ